MRKFKIAYLRFLKTGKVRIRLDEKDFEFVKKMYLEAIDFLKNYREVPDETLMKYNRIENNVFLKAIFYIAIAIKYGYRYNRSFYERIKKEIDNLRLTIITNVYLPSKKLKIIIGYIQMKVKSRNLIIIQKDSEGKISRTLTI